MLVTHETVHVEGFLWQLQCASLQTCERRTKIAALAAFCCTLPRLQKHALAAAQSPRQGNGPSPAQDGGNHHASASPGWRNPRTVCPQTKPPWSNNSACRWDFGGIDIAAGCLHGATTLRDRRIPYLGQRCCTNIGVQIGSHRDALRTALTFLAAGPLLECHQALSLPAGTMAYGTPRGHGREGFASEGKGFE